jgi:hypothetical protein
LWCGPGAQNGLLDIIKHRIESEFRSACSYSHCTAQ